MTLTLRLEGFLSCYKIPSKALICSQCLLLTNPTRHVSTSSPQIDRRITASREGLFMAEQGRIVPINISVRSSFVSCHLFFTTGPSCDSKNASCKIYIAVFLISTAGVANSPMRKTKHDYICVTSSGKFCLSL